MAVYDIDTGSIVLKKLDSSMWFIKGILVSSSTQLFRHFEDYQNSFTLFEIDLNFNN